MITRLFDCLVAKEAVHVGPIIGIVCGHDTNDGRDRYYVSNSVIQAVSEAGAVPILIPYTDDEKKLAAALNTVGGVVLPGGVDVDPYLYGEEPVRGLGRIDPEWDALDVTAARLALERNVPVLGLCRGMQVLNVAAGGTLWQDIPSQVKGALQHSQKAPRWAASHGVTIDPDSKLGRLLGAELRVNSYHHQAVKDVAPGFQVTAEAADGIVEAIEGDEHVFAVGVQWHPELMTDSDPVQRRLFEGFVEAAAKYTEERSQRSDVNETQAS